MAIKPINYYQLSSLGPYGPHDYSAPGEKKTISEAGCGPTSSAMLIQTLRPDTTVTPITTADWSKAHGYKIKNQGTSYAYFTPQFKQYGIECKQLNSDSVYHNTKSSVHDNAKKALKDGNHFLIACMGPGNWTSSGHYIVIYKIDDNNNVYINDPASTSSSRTKSTWSKFSNEVKYYWKIKYGDGTKTNTDCNLYKDMDVIKGKLAKVPTGTKVYHIKDMKNGWSIATDGNHVGYIKNKCLNKEGLSAYKKATTTEQGKLHKSNDKDSEVICTVPQGSKVEVITKRDNWTNVIYDNKNGYFSTKKLKF